MEMFGTTTLIVMVVKHRRSVVTFLWTSFIFGPRLARIYLDSVFSTKVRNMFIEQLVDDFSNSLTIRFSTEVKFTY